MKPSGQVLLFASSHGEEMVIAKRKEEANVKYRDIGLDSDDIIHLAVYEHLTPRLQELLV